MTNRSRILFLSHGGGPLPLLGDPGHRELVACLHGIAAGIPTPAAIVVISAHWEAAVPTITAGEQPGLIYDYYGFPDDAYRIEYACPGAPWLAGAIGTALHDAGIEAALDDKRGFDHGVFIPLTIMYPQAEIPCVQVSLIDTLDPAQHIRMGQALGRVRADNLLVIGSGFSFHNMKAFFAAATADSAAKNDAFEDWLMETCADAAYAESERAQRLIRWQQAPHARYCHPREEHLLPLHVCYGMAQTPCSSHYALRILNKKASMYLW